MKSMFITIVIIFSLMSTSLIAAAVPSNSGRVFYVDNISGNDGNAGNRGPGQVCLWCLDSVSPDCDVRGQASTE